MNNYKKSTTKNNNISLESLTKQQISRILELHNLCFKEGTPLNTCTYVPINDDESIVALSIVSENLNTYGFDTSIISRIVTEYDSYHCHDYDVVKTFLVIIPRLKKESHKELMDSLMNTNTYSKPKSKL
jgi:hypothetical protein